MVTFDQHETAKLTCTWNVLQVGVAASTAVNPAVNRKTGSEVMIQVAVPVCTKSLKCSRGNGGGNKRFSYFGTTGLKIVTILSFKKFSSFICILRETMVLRWFRRIKKDVNMLNWEQINKLTKDDVRREFSFNIPCSLANLFSSFYLSYFFFLLLWWFSAVPVGPLWEFLPGNELFIRTSARLDLDSINNSCA